MAGRYRRMASRVVVLGTLILAGCASFSPDGGFNVAGRVARKELGKDAVWIRSSADATAVRRRVGALLDKPLTAESAVQVAILNNRGLQAAYSELGISEARYVQAGLPPNPVISVARLARGEVLEIERSIAFDFLALLTLPSRTRIAERSFEQAKLRAAEATVRTALEARRAFYQAIAARQLQDYMVQASTAAEATAGLARKLGEAGTLGKLDQAREQAFHAEISADLARARLRSTREREALNRALGLWGTDLDYKLPSRVPSLPRQPQTLKHVESEALRRRLDIAAARLEVERVAKSYGLTNATRFVDVFEAAFQRNSESGEKVQRGVELELQVPFFDFGGARLREAEQVYMRAVHLLAERAVNVRSEVRVAYKTYRTAYDLARHYRDEILPLRKIVSEETLLRYNAMLISPLELIQDARDQIDSASRSIEARRDFWIADIELVAALIGGGGSENAEAQESAGGSSRSSEEGGH